MLMKRDTKMEQAGTCALRSQRNGPEMGILHLPLNSKKDGSEIVLLSLLSFI